MGGKTSAAAKNRYNAKAYDRVTIMLPKGDRERLKEIASVTGETVGGYIKAAIQQRIYREQKEKAEG